MRKMSFIGAQVTMVKRSPHLFLNLARAHIIMKKLSIVKSSLKNKKKTKTLKQLQPLLK